MDYAVGGRYINMCKIFWINGLRRRREIIVLLAVVLLVGCHGTKQAVPTTVPETPAITENQETPDTQVPRRTYTVLNFTGEAEGLSVNGQLRVAQDSAIWIAVYKYLEVARGLATPDSLWLRSSLLSIDKALDYKDLRQYLHRRFTYSDLQEMVLADDADERISQLARQLGINATVHITRRQQVSSLTFPYNKQP